MTAYGEALGLTVRQRPEENPRWVVLDRIEPGEPKPDYCIHGRASCAARCGEWVWLGNTTHDMVRDQGYLPICKQCASRYAKTGPHARVVDHKRAWGPHE